MTHLCIHLLHSQLPGHSSQQLKNGANAGKLIQTNPEIFTLGRELAISCHWYSVLLWYSASPQDSISTNLWTIFDKPDFQYTSKISFTLSGLFSHRTLSFVTPQKLSNSSCIQFLQSGILRKIFNPLYYVTNKIKDLNIAFLKVWLKIWK